MAVRLSDEDFEEDVAPPAIPAVVVEARVETVLLSDEALADAAAQPALPFHRAEHRAEASPSPRARGALPLRRGDAIPFVHATSFEPFTLAGKLRPPRFSRTVAIKGTFDLMPAGAATPRPSADLPTGDIHVDGDPARSILVPSDLALWKPKADVMLIGNAWAPGGRASAARVRFRFGNAKGGFDRSIAVFGDRSWQKSGTTFVPGAPLPFEKVPLVYERAFGGPGFDRNPVGLGFDEAGGARLIRLPNLEDPRALITSPSDATAPACFGAVPAMWPERRTKLGTYDEGWLRTRWPYQAADVDWAHFQSAPASQQVSHLRGDEPFLIEGMHATHPHLEGTLPGIRARCFAQTTPAHGGSFAEVALALDTATFLVDTLTLTLVWRGVIDVDDEEASAIAALYVRMEALDGVSATVEEARAAFEALCALNASDPARTGAATPSTLEAPEAPAANDTAPTAASTRDAADRADAEARYRELREKLLAAGVASDWMPETLDEDESHPPTIPVAEMPDVDVELLVEQLRKAEVSEEEIAGFREAVRAAGAQAEPAPPSSRVRDEVIERLSANRPLGDLDLAGADLSGLDLSSRALPRARLKGTKLRATRLDGADLTGAQLGGADLTRANLDGANLAGADFHGAVLERATLRRANLSGAHFDEAHGEEATFAGATGDRTSFVGGRFRGARFDGVELASADFTAATLDDAVFRGAKLPDVRLYDARGERVVFDDASITEARADEVRLVRSSLERVRASGSIWDKADLEGSSFAGSTLAGASLVRASCRGTVFAGADLSEARFTKASLVGASLQRANLRAASLEGADLTGADVRGANLHAAGTRNAKLDEANLHGAIVTKTALARDA